MEILQILYQVRGDDYSGIKKFIEYTSRYDAKKSVRRKFFSKYLDYYKNNKNKTAAEYIYEDIKHDLGLLVDRG